MKNRVIVQSILGGDDQIGGAPSQEGLAVAAGDIGVMYWVVTEHFRSPEARVIWDRDLARIPRTVLLQNVEVIGIERNGYRVWMEARAGCLV